MYIINTKTEERIECFVEEIHAKDFLMIQKNFSGVFDWKKETVHHKVFKLFTVKVLNFALILLKRCPFLVSILTLDYFNIY